MDSCLAQQLYTRKRYLEQIAGIAKKRGFYQYQSAINVRRHYSCSARHVCVCRGTCWMHASPHGYLYKSYDAKSVARFNVSSRPDTTERGKTKSEMTKFGCFFAPVAEMPANSLKVVLTACFVSFFRFPLPKGDSCSR